jgi:hypothetical protein
MQNGEFIHTRKIPMSLRPMMTATILASLIAGSAHAQGQLALYANGEDLATLGFIAPKLTRDGWQLQFDHIFVTFGHATALLTDPPFNADSDETPTVEAAVDFEAVTQMTIDLVQGDADDRLLLENVHDVMPAHYNAMSWSIAPAEDGDFAGQSMVFIGTATKDGESVAFTLTSSDTHEYLCGEYVGDMRKGIVAEGGAADLEVTFHLDHIFGRADRDQSSDMNAAAIGFVAFAAGGEQVIDLSGLHIGHVGEGHCAVTFL